MRIAFSHIVRDDPGLDPGKPGLSLVSLNLSRSHHPFLIICGAIALLLQPGTSFARTWTNPDGQTIEAEILEKHARTVTLQLADGKKVELAINKLSVDDQLYIMGWSKPPRRPFRVPEDAVYHEGSWYAVVFESGITWSEAVEKADRLGAELASVKSPEVNALLTELAQGERVWLGASDAEEEGRWVWADGSSMDYSHWEDFQPSNQFEREHYLCLTPDGLWDDLIEAPRRMMRVSGYVLEWD